MQMNTESFSRLVAEEVKGRASSAQRDYLMMADNWDRWQKALIALVDNLENQLQGLDDDEKANIERYKAMGSMGTQLAANAIVEFDGKRTKIKRFMHFVKSRLEEVTGMVESGERPDYAEEEKLSAFLKKAIEKHRELMNKFDLDTGPLDEALYLALSGKWEFDSITEDDFSDEE